MDTFRLVVFNTPGENPCRFQNATQATLDLREGQWWVALASVLRNFCPREKDSETIFIHCNLIEPIAFGGFTQSVLRAIDDDTPMIAYSRKELHYIKANNSTFNNIHIELVNADGRVVSTDRDKSHITITLSFIHIPDPDASESGGGKLDLHCLL